MEKVFFDNLPADPAKKKGFFATKVFSGFNLKVKRDLARFSKSVTNTFVDIMLLFFDNKYNCSIQRNQIQSGLEFDLMRRDVTYGRPIHVNRLLVMYNVGLEKLTIINWRF